MTVYESLPGYCKYMSDSAVVLESTFVERKIRFTQPAALNDPLDCNPVLRVPSTVDEHSMFRVSGVSMPSVNLWYYMQLVQSHRSPFGVLSLTKNPVAFDMWSMYANGHRGFLIELAADFPAAPEFQSPDGAAYEVRKVEYVDNCLIDLATVVDATGTFDIDKFRERIFFQKARRWAKEKEYRMVRPLSDMGRRSRGMRTSVDRDMTSIYKAGLPFSKVRSVTFGANMPPEGKHWIIEKCRGSGVQFMQCMVYPLRSDDEGLSPLIELVPLDDPNMMKRVIDLEPQLLLSADVGALGHQTVDVSVLADLPYYKGFERLAEAMYEARRRRSSRATVEKAE